MIALTRLLLGAACAILPVLVLPAQDAKPPAKADAPQGEKAKDPTFVVAMVGADMKAMAATEVDAKKKALADEFKKAHEAWQADKKAAEAKKAKFDAKEPVQTAFEIKKDGLKTMDEANAWIKEAQAKAKGDSKGKTDDKPKGKDDKPKGKGKV